MRRGRHLAWRRDRRGTDDTPISSSSTQPGGGRDVSTPVSALAANSDVIGDDRASIDIATTSRVRTDFDQAFVDHYERLVRALTVVAGDREAAADAVQEAFVKAHLRWGRISRYDDPVGWIRRVAINHLRDDHRKNVNKRKVLARLATRGEIEHPTPRSTSSTGCSRRCPGNSVPQRRCSTSRACPLRRSPRPSASRRAR